MTERAPTFATVVDLFGPLDKTAPSTVLYCDDHATRSGLHWSAIDKYIGKIDAICANTTDQSKLVPAIIAESNVAWRGVAGLRNFASSQLNPRVLLNTEAETVRRKARRLDVVRGVSDLILPGQRTLWNALEPDLLAPRSMAAIMKPLKELNETLINMQSGRIDPYLLFDKIMRRTDREGLTETVIASIALTELNPEMVASHDSYSSIVDRAHLLRHSRKLSQRAHALKQKLGLEFNG